MKNNVMKSINDPTGMFCVDICSNDEGKFSFKSFRRDLEDNSGWYLFGPESDFIYFSSEDALIAATQEITWLNQA